ncbi:UNVERIFIED_CONTAM: hypothetical protein Slati_3080600 [Sesamum latifolium]|uniref:Uncharacterized protein n=1 Tax=Sesamum latifolium TaxID=2727402 RepID=A0AAW2UUW5_9LAMI
MVTPWRSIVISRTKLRDSYRMGTYKNMCWEKARGTGPYQKKETDRAKEPKGANHEASPRGGPKAGTNEKMDPNDIPRKGIIRMMTGGPIGGDSHHARKAEIRKAHGETITEVLDVETAEDAPIIQFGRAERSGPRSAHNDALVITALLANYEVERIFIDSGSSADILFGDAFDQMQLGDTPLEEVNTSLYGFAGEVVHPRGLISLPLTLGTGSAQRTHVLKFLVVDVPSAYNVVLGRPILNIFQAGQKRSPDEAFEETPYGKRSREGDPEKDLETDKDTPPKVQHAEELLNIELIPGDTGKTTWIGSQIH